MTLEQDIWNITILNTIPSGGQIVNNLTQVRMNPNSNWTPYKYKFMNLRMFLSIKEWSDELESFKCEWNAFIFKNPEFHPNRTGNKPMTAVLVQRTFKEWRGGLIKKNLFI